ncbi:MAG: ribonuclease III family protein [Candidatus Bathyarchaeia archaeon]
MIRKRLSFVKNYETFVKVLTDHGLASLGDAYINFAFSLAVSEKSGKPSGAKVKGSLLAQAFRKAGLREYMPSRVSRHSLADAAEAMIVYAWLCGYISLEESISILVDNEDAVEGLSQLLTTIKERIKF